MNDSLASMKVGDQPETEDAISIPLYLSGLAVSILGILAVNSALGDSQFGSTTLVLTALGFVFSIACRWLRIKVHVVEVLGSCVVVYFVYRYLTHSFSFAVFIPPEITQSDLVMAVVLEWLTVVRSWVLTSDESVVFTSVTSIAMIGLVGASNINTELLVYFFAYTVGATFLMLHQNYLTQRSWQITRAAHGSESHVITLQLILALFSGIAAIMMATVIVIPLKAIGSHLSLASTLKNFVGNQHGGEAGPADNGVTVSLSDDPTFNIGTGDGFTASNVVVMRVRLDPPGDYYYRGRTYDTYLGSGWSSSSSKNAVPLTASPQSAVGRISYVLPEGLQPGSDPSEPISQVQPVHRLSARFSMASGSTNTLYIPYGTVRVEVPTGQGINVSSTPDNSVGLNDAVGGAFTYEAYSLYPDASVEQLEALPPIDHNTPLDIHEQYVDQKGDNISKEDEDRLFITANEIVRSVPLYRRTEFNVAEAIRSWVSRRALYSLNVAAVPSGQDSVSYFLFDSRRGYCDLFASSMAILCRYAGIPARVATGFDGGVQNERGGYDLRERDKHAWVEVWFPEYGWQTFDPTEGSIQDNSVNANSFDLSWLWKYLAAVRLYFEIHGVLPVIFLFSIGGGLAYVFKIELYDKRFGPIASRATSNYRTLDSALKALPGAAAQFSKLSAQDRYAELERFLAVAGLRRLPSQTPDEFYRTIEKSMVVCGADIADAVKRLTDDVTLASYAPIGLVGESLVEMEREGGGAAALALIKQNSASLRKIVHDQKREAALR